MVLSFPFHRPLRPFSFLFNFVTGHRIFFITRRNIWLFIWQLSFPIFAPNSLPVRVLHVAALADVGVYPCGTRADVLTWSGGRRGCAGNKRERHAPGGRDAACGASVGGVAGKDSHVERSKRGRGGRRHTDESGAGGFFSFFLEKSFLHDKIFDIFLIYF